MLLRSVQAVGSTFVRAYCVGVNHGRAQGEPVLAAEQLRGQHRGDCEAGPARVAPQGEHQAPQNRRSGGIQGRKIQYFSDIVTVDFVINRVFTEKNPYPNQSSPFSTGGRTPTSGLDTERTDWGSSPA